MALRAGVPAQKRPRAFGVFAQASADLGIDTHGVVLLVHGASRPS
jgi:hypothetical protein